MMERVNVAYVGIGAPVADSVLMRSGSLITGQKLDELSALGAVGDIALRFFDVHGQPVAYDLANCVLSVTVEQLKGIERVVGVSGGSQKRLAVRGALEGQLIDVLITDHVTANSLLADAL
jgi:DNA-binding transcriptional regulator LsrR (DeoR family)